MLNNIIGDWVRSLPAVLQYIVVIAIVLIILYICLVITRLFGKNRGAKVHYDNPEEYEKQIPDLFASTAFRRKSKAEEDKKD